MTDGGRSTRGARSYALFRACLYLLALVGLADFLLLSFEVGPANVGSLFDLRWFAFAVVAPLAIGTLVGRRTRPAWLVGVAYPAVETGRVLWMMDFRIDLFVSSAANSLLGAALLLLVAVPILGWRGRHVVDVGPPARVEPNSPDAESNSATDDDPEQSETPASDSADGGSSADDSQDLPSTAASAGTDGPVADWEETDTPATAFASACDAVAAARTVDDDGAVHVYEAVLGDREGIVEVAALAPAHADDPDARDAFRRRARTWNGIGKNARVATVFAVGDDPRPWVAFDPGAGALAEALDGNDREDAPDAMALLWDVTEALRTGGMYNVAHGGIDPATVRLTGREDSTAVVADWGLRRAVGEAVGEPPVTPYTAPEQLSGEAAGARTDAYRVGALSYRLLTGEPPVSGDGDSGLEAAVREGEVAPPSDRADVPPAVDDVLLRALAADPAGRYESASAFRGALEGALP